jgi:uncharacterized protein YbjT (DUF2867 family)
MKKRILITGASGMIGSTILKHALLSEDISQVVSLVRKPSTNKNKKLNEIIIPDFKDYKSYEPHFKKIDIAYFCIGTYTGQVPDIQLKKITVDYVVAFIKQLKEHSSNARFCFLSGAGADQTEDSKMAFTRYKGMAENRISESGLEYYNFRPWYIYPITPRKEPNLIYKTIRHFYPILKLFGDKYSITSTQLAHAIFLIGQQGYDKKTLENKDIVNFAKEMSLK